MPLSRRLLAYGEQKEAKRREVGAEAKSARTPRNPRKHAGVGKKKPTGDPVGFSIWWWNTEPNPRPQSDPDSNALALRP